MPSQQTKSLPRERPGNFAGLMLTFSALKREGEDAPKNALAEQLPAKMYIQEQHFSVVRYFHWYFSNANVMIMVVYLTAR